MSCDSSAPTFRGTYGWLVGDPDAAAIVDCRIATPLDAARGSEVRIGFVVYSPSALREPQNVIVTAGVHAVGSPPARLAFDQITITLADDVSEFAFSESSDRLFPSDGGVLTTRVNGDPQQPPFELLGAYVEYISER